MSEAENESEWRNYLMDYTQLAYSYGAIELYKEALRSAIESLEKRKNKHYFPSQYDLAFNDAIDMVLQKLDSVTPKE